MSNEIPEKWNKNKEAVKAIQVAFELEEGITQSIKMQALQNDLTSSAQIRKVLGLDFTPPKRPRLTISLSKDDYIFLGKKYNIDSKDIVSIKRKMIEELILFYRDNNY